MKQIIVAIVLCLSTTVLIAQNTTKPIVLKSSSIYHSSTGYSSSSAYTPSTQSPTTTVTPTTNGGKYISLSSTPDNVAPLPYSSSSSNSDLNYMVDDAYGQSEPLTLPQGETVMEKVTYKVDGVLRTELVPVSRSNRKVKIVDGVTYSED